jgi:putative endonuclease
LTTSAPAKAGAVAARDATLLPSQEHKRGRRLKPGYVYLMANHRRGQTYLGVTSNLIQRAYQHRDKLIDGHSKDKDCTLLVWCKYHDDLQDARRRELQMKKWKRAWKLRLIEEQNPEWNDLYGTLF